jgi:hypothetical protein
MAGDVADAPGRGGATARELRRDVHYGDEGKLHPPESLRLMKPEQPGLVQELLVLANEHAGVLGRLRALAQKRHDLACPAHRLLAADVGEVAAQALRQRAHRTALQACTVHHPLSTYCS